MVYLVLDKEGKELFAYTKHECHECIAKYFSKEYVKLACPSNNEERRLGCKQSKIYDFYLCSDCKNTKTTKLFKEKIEMLVYSVPSLIQFKKVIEDVVRHEETEKYSKIVHNLKTLNAQSLLSQYKFISQDAFADNYENLFESVLQEVIKRPKDATIALLKQSKNNEHMKTEFSTHEKLSIDNPVLFKQNHIFKKVLLNVYHSFDTDFRNKNVTLKVDDLEIRANFDYDTVRVAIYHLFSNAIKYIAENSQLCIKISKEGDFINVAFCMKSFYIFQDEVNAIFGDHFSGKVALSQKLNGSGMGMGLIKKALLINGGSIEIIAGSKKIKIKNIDYAENVFIIAIPISN